MTSHHFKALTVLQAFFGKKTLIFISVGQPAHGRADPEQPVAPDEEVDRVALGKDQRHRRQPRRGRYLLI